MSRYASQTQVSSERSRAEIEQTLRRYGATGFVYMARGDQALIGFEYNGRAIKFSLPLPDPQHTDFTRTPGGRRERSPEEAHAAWEQGCRQAWRALSLCIKAKLEAVEAGITTFESEFLAHFVMKGGKTLGEKLLPHLEELQGGGEPMKLIGMS